MTDWLGFLWMLMLLSAAGWLVAGVTTPLLLRVLPRPARATVTRRRLWLLALLPVLLPASVAAGVAVLGTAKAQGWLHDHCLYHAPHHPHFCFEHLPDLLLSYPHAFVAVLLAGLLVYLAWGQFNQQRRQARHVAALRALASSRRRLKILENDQVAAFAAGLRQPGIFLSRGLLNRLDKREQRIVVAHEAAHIRHRDLWLNALYEALLLLHLPPVAGRLRQCWRQAMEEQADDRVAARFGPTAVAATLLDLTKLAAAPNGATAASGADTRARIERLLRQQEQTPSGWWFESAYWLALAAVGTFVIAEHHRIETMLGLVVRG